MCMFCICFTSRHDKLSAKSIKCIFLGYSRCQKGYCCYNLILRRTFITMGIAFFEHVPFNPSTSPTSQFYTHPIHLSVFDQSLSGPPPHSSDMISPLPTVHARQLKVVPLQPPQTGVSCSTTYSTTGHHVQVLGCLLSPCVPTFSSTSCHKYLFYYIYCNYS